MSTSAAAPAQSAHKIGRSPLRVVLAEPHATVRRAMRSVLAAEPRIEVVAEVQDLAAAGAAVRRCAADALVVDAREFGADRDLLGALPPSTAVVAAGMDDDPGMAAYFVKRGAAAYVLKDTADATLADVLLRLSARRD